MIFGKRQYMQYMHKSSYQVRWDPLVEVLNVKRKLWE